MPFLDFFRNIFGLHRSPSEPQSSSEGDQKYQDSFRNPIWQNDDDDEDDINDFSRQSGSSYSIYSDPFQITRFFESQLDELLSNFFGGFDGFGNHFPSNFGNDGFSNALPPSPDEQYKKGLRDEVLKPDLKTPFDEFTNVFPEAHSSQKPCDAVLKPSFEMPDPNKQKVDSDIDGKIRSDELAKIWKAPSSSELDRYIPQVGIHSFGSSVSTKFIKRPDGSIEEHHTIRDSDGNEEIKVTRKIGDKIHSVITKKTKDGSEIKTEDLFNMDESELKDFNEKWIKFRIPQEDRGKSFPWHIFFGPSPKL